MSNFNLQLVKADRRPIENDILFFERFGVGIAKMVYGTLCFVSVPYVSGRGSITLPIEQFECDIKVLTPYDSILHSTEGVKTKQQLYDEVDPLESLYSINGDLPGESEERNRKADILDLMQVFADQQLDLLRDHIRQQIRQAEHAKSIFAENDDLKNALICKVKIDTLQQLLIDSKQYESLH